MAPYKSDKQRRFFHTLSARKQGITPKMVKEYDTASKGMSLPTSAKLPEAPKAPKPARFKSLKAKLKI